MLRKSALGLGLAFLVISISELAPAHAQAGGEANLAEQLSNPVASLISVPFQFNYDTRIGPEREGDKFYLNVQPVVPIPLDKDWNLISRTILPIVSQNEIFPGADDQSGLGDTLQSFFLSPKAPGPGGIVWGVGPALLLPTATDRLLGSGKWAAGPTAVVLTQQSGWTVGILVNHVWSYAGDDDRADVNSTFLQPFIAYTTKNAWTYTLNSESTYDWVADQWRCRSISLTSRSASGQGCATGRKAPPPAPMTSAPGRSSPSSSQPSKGRNSHDRPSLEAHSAERRPVAPTGEDCSRPCGGRRPLERVDRSACR